MLNIVLLPDGNSEFSHFLGLGDMRLLYLYIEGEIIRVVEKLISGHNM